MKSATAEWVRCFYDAWNRRDWEWIDAMLAEDVEWFNSARDERVRGVTAVVNLFRNTVAGYPEAQLHVRSLHEAGAFAICECGISRGKETATSRRTAIRPATFCEVLELQSGRCLRGSTYADQLRLLMELEHQDAA